MAPNDDRGGDTRESDRIAPDARRTDSDESDSDPPLAFAVEPMPSNEQLERFASFTETVRDALGEFGGVQELSPDEAAKQGCLSTLRSLHRRGRAELTVELCASAAKGGQLKVLQWLRENECPWDEDTCRAATKGGHLEVLKWARANGCPWNEGAIFLAAKNDHVETCVWAMRNGCPVDTQAKQAMRALAARIPDESLRPTLANVLFGRGDAVPRGKTEIENEGTAETTDTPFHRKARKAQKMFDCLASMTDEQMESFGEIAKALWRRTL